MLAAVLMLPTPLFAQRGGAADSDSKAVADEYQKRIDAARTIGPLGDELFGDHINAYTGALEFSVLDVTLPGNSALPVEIRRRLDINGMSGRPRLARTTGWFGDWDLDVPHMHGVFAGSATSGSCERRWRRRRIAMTPLVAA